MSVISNITENIYSDIGLNSPSNDAVAPSKELGQSDFLALLSTQLANQDPLSPTDSKEFITQMTQFSSVDSLQSLVNKFDDLSTSLTSNQALQASSLVGRSVLIPSSVGYVSDESGMSGQINLPSQVNNLRFEIRDSSGQLVRNIEVGDREGGDIEFFWDGRNEEGEFIGEGQYEVAALASVSGQTEQIPTSIRATVQSVNLAAANGGIFLNLSGLGQVNFNDIKEVG
jgi:flagellar basal-body rod modification protein FlgD